MNQLHAPACRRIATLVTREWAQLFFTPAGYVILALFTCGTSLLFLQSLAPGAPATLRPTLGGLIWLLAFAAPAVSMRLLSDEYRSGTIEMLMTLPVRRVEVVLGKWLGGMGLMAALLSPVLLLALLLHVLSNPDPGAWLTGWIGLLLVAGLYLAIGLFISSLTENQLVCFMASVFLILLLTLGTQLLAHSDVAAPWSPLLFALNPHLRFEEFNRGLIRVDSVVYFLSTIALFLYLTTEVLRWRCERT